jgi:hypothetical protein
MSDILKEVLAGTKTFGSSTDSDSKGGSFSDDDLKALAKEVIKGSFGNGETRKKLLGDDYDSIQKIVNQMLKSSGSSSSSSKKKSSNTSSSKKKSSSESTKKKSKTKSSTKSSTSSSSTTASSKGIDMKKVLSVYNKK